MPLALFIAVSASVIVDCAWFDFGRSRKSNPGRAFKRLQSVDSRTFRVAHLFARHGAVAMLLARFLPGPNLAAALAGLSGLSRIRFVVLDTIVSVLWGDSLSAAGHFLPRQLRSWISSTMSASPGSASSSFSDLPLPFSEFIDLGAICLVAVLRDLDTGRHSF